MKLMPSEAQTDTAPAVSSAVLFEPGNVSAVHRTERRAHLAVHSAVHLVVHLTAVQCLVHLDVTAAACVQLRLVSL